MADRSVDAAQLRRLAGAVGDAAERVSARRLELESRTAATCGALEVRHRWTVQEGPALGALATALRRARTDLLAAADAHERRAGRRLGGYASPAYLGAGRSAEVALREAGRRTAETGAGIGAALLEGAAAPPLPGAWVSAHALGESLGMPESLPTPDPPDEDD